MRAMTDEHVGLERLQLTMVVAGSMLMIGAVLAQQVRALFAPVLTALR